MLRTEKTDNKYVYITVRRGYVSPQCAGNRPGWHSDGFMSNDINYIWCDKNPTEFSSKEIELSQDHKTSLLEMEDKLKYTPVHTFPANSLLRLTEQHIHRVPICEAGVRTFVKVSISDKLYDLIGNSINYNLDYPRPNRPRELERNDP